MRPDHTKSFECWVDADYAGNLEDNGGAIELVWPPKIQPRMKHINNYYHHFWSHTEGSDPEITVRAVSTNDQLGDMFTKPLPETLFTKFWKQLMGW